MKNVTFSSEPRPRVSTRVEILEDLGGGQWHPATRGHSRGEPCPVCDASPRAILGHVSARGWLVCTSCNAVIELATGRAFVAAGDVVPAGADVGALGEEVEAIDIGLSRKPRVG